MGTMSASDAAPLPRLGEVFFDVRGSARSLRLSWYAETGVAVFSIWQAGTCTGTFRLPMGELDRMIDTLRRGPGRQPLADDTATAFFPGSPEHALGSWEDEGDEGDEEAGPPDYEGRLQRSQVPTVSGQRTGHHDRAGYPPTIGPYPAGIGPLDYTAARSQAHYLPDAPDYGYDPESAHITAISGTYNGETVPGRGRRGKPGESFPYGEPAGP